MVKQVICARDIVLLAFVLVLLSTAVDVRFVRPVTANGTIYIKADGSVEGTDKIQRDGNVYIFTGNIGDPIVVQRTNIVVDGAGYTLQGTGSGKGIEMSYRSNLTIKNMRIRYFNYGIYLQNSSENTISGNNITENIFYGIWLTSSSNNNVSGNNIRNNHYGIWLTSSSNNNVSGNNISAHNEDGIWLTSSSNNNVSGNNIRNNRYGIRLDDYSNNIFRNNDVSNNQYNFGIFGSLLPEFIQDADDSNTVNGKPVYYWVNKRDIAVPLDAGYVALVNCTSITVKNLNLANNGQGVLLAFTTNSTITKSNITNNIYGIYLAGSSNNTVYGNNIAENIGGSMYLHYSSDNTFSHNNFINNTKRVYTVGISTNLWDDGVEGNYWSDYEDRYPNATELDGSGIWDTPYVVDGNNRDNYPIVPEFPTWISISLLLVVFTVAIHISKRRRARAKHL